MKRFSPPDTSWQALLQPWISTRYFNLPHPPAFDIATPDFSLFNAWWLCELSRLIYRQGSDEGESSIQVPTRSEILETVGLMEIVSFCDKTNYGALVTTQPGLRAPFTILVFRGTKGLLGWPTNMNSILTSWSGGGSVHLGFKTGFTGLWEKIEPVLSKMETPLFITGHSLGGAMAVLAASRRPDAVAYTFGAPQTGDAAFARALECNRVYRVENACDVVTTLPPAAALMGYCPVGFPIRLGDDNNKAFNCDTIRKMVDPPEFLTDHSPINYTIRIENMLNP